MLSEQPHTPLDLAEFLLDPLYDEQGALVLAMDKRRLSEALEPQETRYSAELAYCVKRIGQAQSLSEALHWQGKAEHVRQLREETDHHQEHHESAAWARVREAAAIGRRLIGEIDGYVTALKRGVVQSLVRWAR
jgi:hypothetical protein